MKRFLIFISLITVLLGANAVQAEAVKPLVDFDTEPVTKPQKYRYGPCEGHTVMDMDVRTAESTQSLSIPLDYTATVTGDHLEWHLVIPEMTVDNSTIKKDVPFIEIFNKTDKFGNLKGSKSSSPAGKKYNINNPQFLRGIQKLSKDMEHFRLALPQAPIVSGDVIYHPDVEFIGAILTGISGTASYVLEGEFTHSGTRYVSTIINSTMTGTINNHGGDGRVELSGRQIHRKDNMDPIYGSLEITFYMGQSKFLQFISTTNKTGAELTH